MLALGRPPVLHPTILRRVHVAPGHQTRPQAQTRDESRCLRSLTAPRVPLSPCLCLANSCFFLYVQAQMSPPPEPPQQRHSCQVAPRCAPVTTRVCPSRPSLRCTRLFTACHPQSGITSARHAFVSYSSLNPSTQPNA